MGDLARKAAGRVVSRRGYRERTEGQERNERSANQAGTDKSREEQGREEARSPMTERGLGDERGS